MAEKTSTNLNHDPSRLIMAACLIVWAGANLCINLFNIEAIAVSDNRMLTIGLALVTVAAPLAIAILLFRQASESTA